MFSFGCFAPVKRLAEKIISRMSCNVSSRMLNLTQLDIIVSGCMTEDVYLCRHRIPLDNWWLKLRPLLRILAKHDSIYEVESISLVARDVDVGVNLAAWTHPTAGSVIPWLMSLLYVDCWLYHYKHCSVIPWLTSLSSVDCRLYHYKHCSIIPWLLTLSVYVTCFVSIFM